MDQETFLIGSNQSMGASRDTTTAGIAQSFHDGFVFHNVSHVTDEISFVCVLFTTFHTHQFFDETCA